MNENSTEENDSMLHCFDVYWEVGEVKSKVGKIACNLKFSNSHLQILLKGENNKIDTQDSKCSPLL